MTHRREFLLQAASAAMATAQSSASVVVLRVSDGRVLEASGDAETWVAPPGSAVKPFVIAYLLRTGKLQARETYFCIGVHRIAGHNFTCTHPTGLPPLDPAHILAYSCNGGVAHFAERCALGELASALRDAAFRVGASDFRLQALGEEGIWTTPMGLARAYLKLGREQNPVIVEGLEGAVAYGTAQAAAVDGVSVAGKTGSALGSNGLHVAWFAGFAPSRAPEFVVVVGMQGRSGGSDAAPVAAQTFRKYFAGAGEQYRVRVNSRILSLQAEEYVAGVLAGESGLFRQTEALKAMAIAARTYAAHERGRHKSEGFDFCDTTHCQRFQQAGVNAQLRAAAQATAGVMIRFDDRLAFTPYTMSCGGSSEAASAVWRDVHADYLSARKDSFCDAKTWGCHLAATDIERALHGTGLECPAGLRSIAVSRRTSSGRAATLALVGAHRVELDAGAFRFAVGRTLGWNLIRSNWFEVSGNFDVTGRGEGHGVGLCQRGAEAMAAQGHSYREILAFYFPGTTTVNWQRLGGEDVVVFGTDPNRDVMALSQAERLVKTLPWRLRTATEIYVYPDMDTFRSETGEPGWIAAHTEGSRIDLQPVAVLNQHGALSNTLHHELLHVAVEQHAVEGLPLWFREGLVEYLNGEATTSQTTSNDALRHLDLRQRSDRGKAAAEIRELVTSYGRAAVLSWVPAGLPATVTNSSAKTPNTNSK